MSPRRFAARRGKVDANQPAIIKSLRRCGASVVDLHAIGGGVSDLLVGFRGENYLLEVKTGTGAVRDSQDDFMADWRGRPPVVVRSEAEAMTAIGVRIDT
jgi:hypothetical protein